jgi:hypothetical protein
LANFSLGFERSENPRITVRILVNPVRVRRVRNPFRVHPEYEENNLGFSLRSNPRLKLANAFGLFSA